MAHFNIYHVKINEFHRVYENLIRALAGALTDLNHSCTVQQNAFAPEAINIVLGSAIFAARYHELANRLRGRPYILYQLEPLDDTRGLLSEWPEYWELLKGAAAIWDYGPSSTAYLRNRGLRNLHHVPPGFHRSLDLFRSVPSPDIDVLFYGTLHPRRQRLIEALKARGLVTVDLQNAFSEVLQRYIARAKVVLNIHAWEGLPPLETVRLSFLLANRVCVVSEQADHNPYGDGVAFGAYDDLVELCTRYVRSTPDIREQVAEVGYVAIRRIDMTTILRDTITAMGPDSLAGLRSAETMRVDDLYYAQARPDMVLLVPPDARRVLDVGCGAGLVGAALKQRQMCHVTGIELFADAAMHANRVLDLAICGDAMQVLPSLPDQAYDCVLLLDVIEHVQDSAELLRRAAGKLTRDGTLLLSVPNVAHWSVIQGLLQGRWDYADQGILDRTHLRFFTLRSLHALLQETGLQVVRVTSTRIDGEPPEAVVDAVRRSTPDGYDMDANLKSYQFIFFCRRL